MKFVHTLNGRGDTIINVKTPQYIIYIVFTTPHSKNTFSLKGQPIGGCLFFYASNEEKWRVRKRNQACLRFFFSSILTKQGQKWSDQNRSLEKPFFCAKNKWYFRHEIYELYRLNKRIVNIFGSLCTLLNGKMVL